MANISIRFGAVAPIDCFDFCLEKKQKQMYVADGELFFGVFASCSCFSSCFFFIDSCLGGRFHLSSIMMRPAPGEPCPKDPTPELNNTPFPLCDSSFVVRQVNPQMYADYYGKSKLKEARAQEVRSRAARLLT